MLEVLAWEKGLKRDEKCNFMAKYGKSTLWLKGMEIGKEPKELNPEQLREGYAVLERVKQWIDIKIDYKDYSEAGKELLRQIKSSPPGYCTFYSDSARMSHKGTEISANLVKKINEYQALMGTSINLEGCLGMIEFDFQLQQLLATPEQARKQLSKINLKKKVA